MRREITLKFMQTTPEQHIENSKNLKEASTVLVRVFRNVFNFKGDIEIIEAKEIILKFIQTIPEQHIENRKTLKEASAVLIHDLKTYIFDGDIEVIEAKEIE